MKPARMMTLGLALAMAGASCIGGVGGAAGFVVAAVTGGARIVAPGGDWQPLDPGRKVADGEIVQVAEGGSVAFTRGAEAQLEVRPSRRAMAEVTITSPDRVEVGAGDLLVTSPLDAPISVASGGISASGLGIYRFDRSLSVRVAVYDGEATVEAPTGSLALPRFRQGVIAGRVLPRAPEPLRFDTGDPWDRRLLADVIDLDLELDAQRRGYQAEFGRRMRSVAPLRDIAGGGGPVGFARSHLNEHDSGDLMIGFVVALLVEERDGTARRGTFVRSLRLLDDGATWGLIAHDRGLDPTELTDAVVRAIAVRTGDVDEGTPIVPPTDGGSNPPPPGGSPTPRTSPSPRPTSSPTPRPTNSPRPSPSPSPSPTPSPTPTDCPLPVPELCENI